VQQLLPASGDADLFRAYAAPDPGVRVNFVTSLDGAATVDGRSDGLSSPADKTLFRLLRALSDVVLVGAGTARIEKYGPIRLAAEHQSWRADQGMPEVPPLAVVSASMDLDPDSTMFTEAVARPLILTGDDAPADRRERLLQVADVLPGDSVGTWLRLLAERGLTRVLCEGGPRLFGTLLGAGPVDELCLTLSPSGSFFCDTPRIRSKPPNRHNFRPQGSLHPP
jgi:riboflavin biosynthesis pyrimidine reductase